ncbi:c-type cytochrome domain-containing protein [Humisphaera borealis]|uniref:Cytochrome c domain-containing protein n=1 Tax=Humisphaera borealis TaxID=2807512 RepID=A0A7M2WVR2_9BACT|nr:c-type cytochrome domain-containing protein [Humisphaera borealis]QOV89513.1 hypothetical protein IPV69_25520 [Humisphaera borealis]
MIFASIAFSLLLSARPLPERLWYAQGLTHPIIVHFPIALLTVAAGVVMLRALLRGKHLSVQVVYACLLVGAGGAVLAALAGWAWAPTKDGSYVDPFDRGSDIFLHRWGGIAVAIASVAILAWATLRVRRPSAGQRGWQAAVVVLAAVTGWVGHVGGELVHPNNLAHMLAIAGGTEEVRIRGSASADAAASAAAPATTRPLAADNTLSVLFSRDVLPILQAKCVACHGADKSKGKLRIDTEAYCLKGGTDGPLYKPGDARQSNLIVRVGSSDPDQVMPPPKEKHAITPIELETLVRWITEGAKWDTGSVSLGHER